MQIIEPCGIVVNFMLDSWQLLQQCKKYPLRMHQLLGLATALPQTAKNYKVLWMQNICPLQALTAKLLTPEEINEKEGKKIFV